MHKSSISRRIVFTSLACLVLLATTSTQAQTSVWPASKPITLIVPYSAGGSIDFAARLIAPKLSARLGQTILIENVTGAGGAVGVTKAVNAAPDGYTLVAAPDSAIAIGKLINPTAFKFDPLLDLAPVGMLNTAPMMLVARPGLPVKNFEDFVKLAKAEPGKYNYATSGVGTVLHLTMEMLKQRSGIYVTHIPYRGGAQIVTDLIGNQIDLAMLVSATTIPHIKDHKMIPMGVTVKDRMAAAPSVPSFSESPALKGFHMTSWTALFAPAKTPPAVVKRLNEALNAVLKEPDVIAKLAEQGALPGSGTAEELGQFAKAEFDRNAKLIQTIDIKP